MAMVKGGTFPVVLCLTDEDVRKLEVILRYETHANRGWANAILHKLDRARQAAANARSMEENTGPMNLDGWPDPHTAPSQAFNYDTYRQALRDAANGVRNDLRIDKGEGMEWFPKPPTINGPLDIGQIVQHMEQRVLEAMTPPPTVEQAIAEAFCDTPFTTQAPHHDTKGDQR